MDKLVEIKHGDIYTNTYIIAQSIDREHESVAYNVQKYQSSFLKLGDLFPSTTRINTRGRPAKAFDLNKAQAIFLMTLMDNSEIVLEFKVQLSLAFVAMERLLLQRQTQEWQQTRLQGKKVRLQETDAIKALIAYAREQGSKNADKLYIVYSKLIKQITEYEQRDQSDIELLTEILAFERLIAGIISTEMQSHTPYKEIYQQAKRQLTEIKRLWAIPALVAAS